MSRKLAYVHLGDSQRLEPGQGHLDFDAVFAGSVTDYDGWASMECNLSGRRRGVLRPAVRFVRAAIARAAASVTTADRLAEAGEIGGRTVQIVASGAVEVQVYPLAPLREGHVRIRAVTSSRSALEPRRHSSGATRRTCISTSAGTPT